MFPQTLGIKGCTDGPKNDPINARLQERIYGLATGVRLVQRAPHSFLLRNYPLKAVRFGESLTSIFRKLEKSGPQSSGRLVALTPSVDETSLDHFLYRLEKMGFLESRGLALHEPLPTVSVVIPVRNRPSDIEQCLESLLKVEYPKEKLEIVVVDDASEDETVDVVTRFPVIVERMSKRQGASACRNRGERHANGQILLFVDSDCVVDSKWLLEIISVFGDPQVGAAGGLVDSYDDVGPLDRYEKVKSPLHVEIRCTDSSLRSRFFYVPSCNFAVRRDLFLKLGGFNEALEVGEDVDLCWRIMDNNRSIEFRPSARVLHRHRNRLRPFCLRRFEYGTSEPVLQGLHPDRRKTFILRPTALVFWSLLAAAFTTGSVNAGLIAVFWILGDALIRRHRAARAGIPLNPKLVLAAVLRSHLSFLYHSCSFISRYYLVWATLLIPVFPLLSAITWCLHLGVGTVEFVSRKPQLNLFSFLALFSLEQLSYQSGVWFGCFRDRFFLPVFPRISMRLAKG